MCGVFFSNNEGMGHMMRRTLAHRGADGDDIREFKGLYLGLNRLAIVDRELDSAIQPYVTGASIIAFNGEIYNQEKLGGTSEINCIEKLMRAYPGNFERFLDGYYAIVRIDKGRERVIVSRDPIGVVPLYYYVKQGLFAIASEKKAITLNSVHVKEVKPGETIEFDFAGRVRKRRRYEPISLHMEPMDLKHLDFLFRRAVERRVRHSEVPVAIALSGGLDSALVLAAMADVRRNVQAVTVTMHQDDPHVERADKLCRFYGIEHRVLVTNPQHILRHWPMIRWYLEDPRPNVIKYAAMIRNYLVAMETSAPVILCGEGADELGGGYPSHARLSGIALQWKCFSTLRSMHAINLDRVNKGGMAHTKEYRVPFLDRALVQYMMACEKPAPGKVHFKQLAVAMGVPTYAIQQNKYNVDDTRFRDLARELLTDLKAPSTAA